jgi:hypothetical protein
MRKILTPTNYYNARPIWFSVCRVWIWAPAASSRIFSTSKNLSQTTLLETLGKSWKFLLHHLQMCIYNLESFFL